MIELLVVIAIIAILAAILMPVFARAREKARTASCQSNLKQIATAVNMYLQDYDERLPNHPDSYCEGGNPPQRLDVTPLGEIYPYIKNHQVFACPSDSGVRPATTWPPDSCTRWASYAFNRFDAGNNADAPFTTIGRNVAEFERPAELIMVLDNPEGDHGFERNGPTLGDPVCGQGFAPEICDTPVDLALPRLFGGASDCSVSYQQHYRRHSEGFNAAFFDGHVKWFRHGGIRTCPFFRDRNHR